MKSNSKTITIVICVTVVLVSAIGAWVYIEDRQLKQQEKEAQQSRQLKETELQQQKEQHEAEIWQKSRENWPGL